MAPSVYEGSFAAIYDYLLDKIVTENSKIVNSSIPKRNGAYIVYIERGDNMVQNKKVDYVFLGENPDNSDTESKENVSADNIVIECQQQEETSVPERIATYAYLSK